MLRQYQLHGGIRRRQPLFGHSKQFGKTTTMAASAAPTPWNCLPPSVDNFRWWDNIFLNFLCLISHDKTPKVHRQFFSEEPHHGKMHVVLVPVLKWLFSCLEPPSVKKIPGEKTLKTSPFLQPQTIHFHHSHRRIQRNRLDTLNVKSPKRHYHPNPSLQGYHHISQQMLKHLCNHPPNQGMELLGQDSSVPQQRHLEFSHPVWALSRYNQGHPPLYCPFPTKSHSAIRTRIEKKCGGQGLEVSNPWDIHGCYT
jgi:hypothetical protein